MRSSLRFITGAILAGASLVAPARAQQEDPDPGRAAAGDEIAVLRREVASLRELVRRLEGQIASLVDARAREEEAAAPPSAVPPTGPPRPTPVIPGASGITRTPSLMNPALSAVFEVTGTTSLDGEREGNGFDLSEAEVALQAVVDPFTRVDLFLAFPADESPEVEEGYISTLDLPGPLQLKGGRFKSSFGKWNRLHSHAYFTADLPNALESYFGEESLTHDGLSLSVLIPNARDLYLESITEIGSATSGPAFNSADRDLTYLQHLKAFFDTTPHSTLEVGATGAWGRTGATESLLEAIEATPMFTGPAPRENLKTNVAGLNVTYKWRPVGSSVYRSFLWQTELLRSRREVQFLIDPATLGFDTVRSLGGYSYLEWQFARRWRAGARYDRLEFPDADGEREWAASTLVRFKPSEFQEIRFQVKHTRRNPAASLRFGGESDDTGIFLEWIPIFGAHGADEY